MVLEKLALKESARFEISHAIDGVIRNFELIQEFAHPHETIKETIEHMPYSRYYRKLLHNVSSASPIPAMVAIGVSVMAS